MKKCVVVLTRDFLAELLQLPGHADIRSFHVDVSKDRLLVTIDGIGDEVPEGKLMCNVQPQVRRTERLQLTWTEEGA